MTSRDFLISQRDYEKRLVSEIQHKLRVLLNCYTVKNFRMTNENEFSFNKSYKIRGIRIDDDNTCHGSYETEVFDEKKVKLKLTVI